MNKEQISIVIPVYNTEKELPQCLDSIKAQTYSEFCVYMIDDASTDSSGSICDQYAKNDARFIACHKENGGPSAARNYALDQIQDGLVFFIDSDDYLPTHTLAYLHEMMIGCDLAIGAYLRVREDGTTCEKQFETPEGILDRKQFFYYLLHEQKYGFIGYLFPKLYKASVIQNFHIRFDETIRHNEDRLFVTEYVLHSEKVRFSREKLYYYRQREGSLTHIVGPTHFSVESLHELFGFEKMKALFEQAYPEEWYRTSRLIFEKALYWEKKIPPKCEEERKLNRKLLDNNFRICIKEPNRSVEYRLKTLAHWLLKE